MVYIRSKKVKGIEYAYLVKSIWNPKKSIARQQILKYLGRVSDISLDKIPIEYRDDAKILSFLSIYAPERSNQKTSTISRLTIKLLEAFYNANLEAAAAIYRNYCKNYDISDFYDNLLKPLMYQVGDLWEQNKIDVATEHVCSNVARGLIQTIIDDTTHKIRKDQTILLCCPDGEQHNLGCCAIESVLLARGYKVLNASPSAPADSIMRYVKNRQIDVILISVTLLENIGPAERLIRSIRSASKLPILIGGQALSKVTIERKKKIIKSYSVQVIEKVQLHDILRLIREVIKKS